MSEAERKRRLDYKINRKKRMIVQAVAILIVALITLSSSVAYYQLNKTYYIDYTETSAVDYKVYLKDNEFYDEEWLGKDQAYVSSLIESVLADFEYELDMDTGNVDYEYSYKIDAQLEIVDNDSQTAIYNPVYEIKEEQKFSQSSNNKLKIYEQVSIDYNEYNDLAKRFVETYNLTDTSSSLILRMYINVIGSCDKFENNSENEYVVALCIPLANKTLNIEMTSTVPSAESKVLACSNGLNQDIFKITAIVSAVIEAILVIIFVAFVYSTRTHDINYSIKVKKLVSAYRSYIQQINNEFDTSGHQVLIVNTFTEMLEIRDTIQSPILMSENKDQTCTRFIIPTNTKLLYLFEIKVDDYDELYNNQEEILAEAAATSEM